MDEKGFILDRLSNPDFIEDMRLRLRRLSDTHPTINLFGEVLKQLGVDKKPQGIDQKSNLHQIFNFSSPMECFTSFRLVSRSWRQAVETTRFTTMLDFDLVAELGDKELLRKMHPTFLKKFLASFQEIWFSELFKQFDTGRWIHYLSKLVSIQGFCDIGENLESANALISQMVTQHQNTLKEIYALSPQVMNQHWRLDKLEEIGVFLDGNDSIESTELFLEKMKCIAPKLRTIYWDCGDNKEIESYLKLKYADAVWEVDLDELDNYTGEYLYAFAGKYTLEEALNKVCQSGNGKFLKLIHLNLGMHVCEVSWGKLEEILTFPNLEAITIEWHSVDYETMDLCNPESAADSKLEHVLAMVEKSKVKLVTADEMEELKRNKSKDKLTFIFE